MTPDTNAAPVGLAVLADLEVVHRTPCAGVLQRPLELKDWTGGRAVLHLKAS